MRFGDDGVSFSGKADTNAAKFGGRFIDARILKCEQPDVGASRCATVPKNLSYSRIIGIHECMADCAMAFSAPVVW